MKKILTVIFLAGLLLPGAAASFQYDGPKELEEAKKAFSEAKYEYGEPKIFVQYNSDAYLPEDTFPDDVEYRRYPTKKHRNARTDFYTKPGFFRKQKFILRKVHVYDNDEKDLRYIIYTDLDGNIKWFVKLLPLYLEKKNDAKNTERRVQQSLVFKGNGELYRRHVNIYTLNHELERATFEFIRFNSRDGITSKETGNWNYYQMMGNDH